MLEEGSGSVLCSFTEEKALTIGSLLGCSFLYIQVESESCFTGKDKGTLQFRSPRV